MPEKQEIKHFVRVLNTDLEGKKPLAQALTKIYGIGHNFASIICNITKIPKNKLTGTLSKEEVNLIEKTVKETEIPKWLYNRQKDFTTGKYEQLTTSDLKLRKEFDIKRLRKLKCYTGMRHSYNLPVRGQRTRAHFRKGRAVGVAKKPKRGKK